MTSRLRFAQALCLALILTFVPAILCAVTVASGFGAYLEYQEWRRKRAESIGNSQFETLAVDREGRGAVAVHDSRGKVTQYLDAQRLPLTVDENADWLVGTWLFHSMPPLHPLRQMHQPRDFPIESLGRFRDAEDWFFVCDKDADSRAVFEGYDAAAHKPVGYIGIDGFQEGPRDESKGFPVSGSPRRGAYPILLSRSDFDSRIQQTRGARFDSNDVLRVGQWILLSGERLFVVDVVVRSVTELLPGTPVLSMTTATRIVAKGPDRAVPVAVGGERLVEYQKWLAVRTADKVVLLNPDAGLREEFILPRAGRPAAARAAGAGLPPPHSEWKERDFLLYLPSDGTAVLTFGFNGDQVRDVQPGIRAYDQDVAAITPAGEVARQDRFTLHVTYVRSQPSERTMYWLSTVAIPGPLPSVLIAGGAIPWLDAYVNQTRFRDRAAVSLGQTWPVLACVTLLAIWLTWRADRHLRACREPRSFIWLSFVFLLGLPGYVAWYCHRRWPVRKPIPPPLKTGTEIIAY